METVLQLKHPVRLGGEEIKELRIRRPKARDYRLLDRHAGFDAAEVMLTALSNVGAAVVEELDGEDYMAASAVVAGLVGKDRSTGEPL